MKNIAKIVVFVSLFSGMVACVPPDPIDSGAPAGPVVGQYETISALLTSTADITEQKTQPPAVVTDTPQPAATDAVMPTSTPPLLEISDTPEAGGVLSPPVDQQKCNAAQAGLPIDISVPDETAFQPGEQFTKIWRLVNSGTCAWSPDYAIVWFSGDDLGLNRIQSVGAEVLPGQTVDLAVDMAAPDAPGIYQSNWKLSDNQGGLFGIGPSSDTPFWVRILVNPAYTATPLPTTVDPTPVAPPVILAQGSLMVYTDQVVDLNAWNSSPLVVEDFRLEQSEETGMVLVSTNGASLAYYGLSIPGFAECLQSPVSEVPVQLDDFPPGAYYCYRTADQMPGRLMLSNIDPHNRQLSLEFITWVP